MDASKAITFGILRIRDAGAPHLQVSREEFKDVDAELKSWEHRSFGGIGVIWPYVRPSNGV